MNRRLILAVFLLLFLTLACGSVGTVTPAQPIDELATMVAATLAASAPPADPGSEAAPGPASGSLRVVYARDGNIWLWAEGAGSRPLTASGGASNPRISSDGQVVVFQRGGGLWTVQSDGANERSLVAPEYLAAFAGLGEAAEIHWFDFAPGMHWLYFNTRLVFIESGMGGPRMDLHRVNANSPAPAQLFAQGQGGDPYFSPDGQWMALSQADKVNLARLDGSGVRTVFTFPPVSTYSEWFYLPELVWMSTSTGFYVITPAPAILDNPNDPARWWYVPLEGSPAQLAAFVTAPVWVSFPRLAPDGTRAVYVRGFDSSPLELHLVDASTADALVASYAGQVFGAGPWSPDGNYLTFWQDDVRNVFYTAPGTTPQSISDAGLANFITWVDGNTVLFKAGSELRLRRLGSASLVIDNPVTETQVDFAP